ncbi:Rieske 2Fe-2S domain-containing protein [Bradyrhizobium tunisiense]|uniref:Rieske 2Fe-2S domain-containing protein n=1 Tax=Bradyrhizobium tunisiense TaxID=3278709 RepID=UPI0035E16F41
MLTQEQNDRLCRIGPRTPMGELFRRYWMPIATADKVREPGSVMAARLLGEDLVVFRGKDGTVGVLDEFCIHRGASLALGRVEECGVRCLYHGWKFGAEGSIQDIMNLPADKRPPKLRAPAYPVVEAGGIVWTYLGPKEKCPPFRRFAFMDLPENQRILLRVDTNCNWVQMIEGGLDSSHVSILHTNAARPGWTGDAAQVVGSMNDTGPSLEIEDTEFGYHYAAFRRGSDGANVRVVPFIMPFGRIIPGGALQGKDNFTIALEVPIDDEHTATYSVRYGSQPISLESRLKETGYDDPELYSLEKQKFLFARGDNAKQRRDIMGHNWSGFRGIAVEDAVIATSMGPISDRTKENLISSDLAIARFRKCLMDSIDRIERGQDPIGVNFDVGRISAIDAAAPEAGHWRTLVPSHCAGGAA